MPFFLSSRRYGVLVNRFELSVFDMGAEEADAWQISLKDAALDLLLFAGEPRSILQKLGQLTGLAPRVPDWAMGVFVSRHLRTRELSTADGIRAMARAMTEHDLPWSGAIIEGWPTFDASRDQELREVVAELHALGKKVMVYDTCGRLEPEHWAMHEARPEFFVRNADGSSGIEEARI